MSILKSYKAKLLFNFTLLFIAFAAVLAAFQMHRETDYRRELLESRLRSYADIVANSVETHGLEADSTQFPQLSHILPSELRLTVISKQGQVKYDSGLKSSGKEIDNHTRRPEVRQALERAEGSDIRVSGTTGQKYFYFAKSYGSFIVRVALPFNESVRDFMKPDNIFLWFLLLIFPVAIVVLIYLSDRFGKSIEGLRHFIDSADRGLIDYDHITFPHSELGDIGSSIMKKYKQLEETGRQIAVERERLLRHFHYFEQGIAIFTPDRKKIYANPKFMQYVNTILDHPTANTDTIWETKEFAPAREFIELNSVNGSFDAGAPVFRFNLAAGGTYFSLQVLIYKDGSFEMTLADVTRAEKNRLLKQQMSNNITHELRTPVSSIRGYIETIIETPNLSPERKRHFLEKAYNQVLRLTDLIRDVALITKTDEAPDTIKREELPVGRIVADIIEELRTPMEEAEMTCDNAVAPDIRIHGNYSLVYSIFRNLMENSIRYSGRGTRMKVECYNQDAEFCYFRFYDTGTGVPEEHLPRLFERFYRITEGRTRDNGGTGLGLSIVKNAVQFHSGTISVRNRKGGGLEFLFTLKK